MWQNRALLLAAAAPLTLSPALAQVTLPSPSSSSLASAPPTLAPDFDKGFALLFELGLPDLSDPRWEYRQLEGIGDRTSPSEHLPENVRADLAALEKTYTRGWVDKSTGDPAHPEKPERVSIDGWQIWNSSQLVHTWGEPRRIGLEAGDEKADAMALVRGLQAIASSEDAKTNLLYSSDTVVSYFFRAAQFHKRGLKAEGNAAVRVLFAMVPRQDRLLDLAVHTLAGAQYGKALESFSKKRNWQSLDADLKRILQTYARGWSNRPHVERLHQLVQKRLSSPQTPPLAEASTLSLAQQAWWALVTDGTPPKATAPADKESQADEDEEGSSIDMEFLGEQWLMGVKMNAGPDGFSELKERLDSLPDWERSIFTEDWDWITVAAAALGDDVLVRQPVSSYDSYGYGFEFNTDTPEMTEEELNDQWKEFHRPRTRGDLARAFLEAVLPYNDNENDSLPTDLTELRALALETAKDVHGKTPLEVAQFYLTAGSNEQKSHAKMGIIQAGTQTDIEEVIALILEQPSLHMQHAAQLVQKQKSAAKPFLDQFRKALLEDIASDPSGDPDTKPGDLPKHLQAQLTALEGIAAGRGAKDVIDDYVSGKLDERKLPEALRANALSDEEKARVPDFGLEAVLRMPKGDGTRKWHLLWNTLSISKELTGSRRQALLKIIQDDGDSPVTIRRIGTKPLSHFLYWTAVLMADTAPNTFDQDTFGFDTEDIWPVRIERGKAILEGKPLPALPTADQVPAARRQELLQAIATHVDQGWPEYVAALPLVEKIALQKELRRAEDTPAWRPLNLRLTRVTGGSPEMVELPAIQTAVGKPISGSFIAALAEICRTQLQQESKGNATYVSLSLTQRPLLLGWQLLVETVSRDYPAGPKHFGLHNVEQWVNRTIVEPDSSPRVLGCAWLRWALNSSENTLCHWHLDPAGKWQNWATERHPELGLPIDSGTVIPEPDIATAFDERLRIWKTTDVRFVVEAGAGRVGPAAKETED